MAWSEEGAERRRGKGEDERGKDEGIPRGEGQQTELIEWLLYIQLFNMSVQLSVLFYKIENTAQPTYNK